MIPAQLLISFAKARKKAYKAYGAWDDQREKAAKRIIDVCQFFLNTQKTGWVSQIQNEITLLMPDPESKDSHWRDKINQILNT